MAQITYDQALWNVIVAEMKRDPTVFVYGWPEGRFFYGNSGPPVQAAVEQLGRDRVPYAMIDETQCAGAAIGAALAGARPIVDLQKTEMAMDGWGQVAVTAAEARWRFGYQIDMRAVFLLTYGAYQARNGNDHVGGYHHWLANCPGLLVALPSTPYDAVGLMRTTLSDVKDPVVFMKPIPVEALKGEVPDGDYKIPFGKADIKREGKDVTIAAIGYMVNLSLQAADDLAKEGINAEVWDPRTLTPLDRASLITSVSKTGALVVVDHGGKSFGATGEFAMTVAEAMSPVPPMGRVTTMFAPIGASPTLEDYVLVTKSKIIDGVKAVIARKK